MAIVQTIVRNGVAEPPFCTKCGQPVTGVDSDTEEVEPFGEFDYDGRRTMNGMIRARRISQRHIQPCGHLLTNSPDD